MTWVEGDFIHVEEEEYAAHTDKSNSDRKCKDRRQLSGCHPSMTNTKTEDVEATVKQILALERAGCEIIRCAVPTMELQKHSERSNAEFISPLVADIHFDYRLAIAAIENGADKIRINREISGSDRVRK